MIIRRKKESGFTLIELLIAIMIMGIVFAAVMQIFSTNYRSYVLQDDVATMQENLRVGMMFLQRDLQMIGSGMIGGDVINAVNPFDTSALPNIGFQGTITKQKGSTTQYVLNGGRAYSIAFQNGTGDETDRKKGSDRITIQYIKTPDLADLKNPDADNSCKGSNPCDKLPSLMGTITGSIFTLSTQSDPAIFVPWQTKWQTCSCGDMSNGGIQPQDLVLITGFTSNNQWGTDIVPITSVAAPPATTITLNSQPVNTYPQGVTISFFNPKNFVTIDYFVATDGSLKRDANDNAGPQDVAENIDDLQFAFGLDPGNDGVDQWIVNQSLDPVNNPNDSLSALNTRMIRVSLLGRTDRPNNTFYTGIRNAIRQAQATTPTPGALEDHNIDVIEANAPAVAQPGRFYVWKLNQTTIKVRNMGMP